MRMILMMVSILIISFLIFKGYSSGVGNTSADRAGGEQFDAIEKAGEVNQLIQDAAQAQRKELEKQMQQ